MSRFLSAPPGVKENPASSYKLKKQALNPERLRRLLRFHKERLHIQVHPEVHHPEAEYSWQHEHLPLSCGQNQQLLPTLHHQVSRLHPCIERSAS